MITKVKTDQEIADMRVSGRILAGALRELKSQIKPGTTSKRIDLLARQYLDQHKATPAFLGFEGFPAAVCVSLNDEIVHGIPSEDKVIQDGDLVTLDLGATYNGMIADAAISFLVGDVNSVDKHRLLRGTRQALHDGIKQIKSGCRVGDISNAIEKILTISKLSIIRDLTGHGVGHNLHESPNIPNFGSKGQGMVLQAGMTLAIEPMATLGENDIMIDSDRWTVKTKDHSLSSQFEHTVLVTETGSEILTKI